MLSDSGAQRKGVSSQPSSPAAQSGEGTGGRLPWMFRLLHFDGYTNAIQSIYKKQTS